MIDLFKVRMSSLAPVEVSKVLTSGYISQGPVVDKFEDLLWEEMPHHNTKPVAVNSCTSAIDLAITLSDVYSGDEVISTPQTCFATNVGAINKGATIRWADVDPVTGLIDPRSIEKILTKKTKAMGA
jgi:dTDP-4-amino-4,6-dideoxygalactose transaminase